MTDYCGFTRACVKTAARQVMVKFRGQDEQPFTENILPFMMGDPSVESITDADTGEVLYPL